MAQASVVVVPVSGPKIKVPERSPIVTERFELSPKLKEALRTRRPNWGFGQLSEAVYYRTYARLKDNGDLEQWGDTIIRVVEGVMSIRKDWYKKNGLSWNDKKYQGLAAQLAAFMFEMKLLPPGRGLWAMGTEYVYERGSHSLNNCGFVDVTDSLADAAQWLMDSLMCGVGVGFSTQASRLPEFQVPLANGSTPPWVIPDTREGWAESTRMLIETYEVSGKHEIHFDYSEIRPAGLPLKGFGGISSGPGPLIKVHERIRSFLNSYVGSTTPVENSNGGYVKPPVGPISQTRLIADVMNAIGACVVAGNVRRSAEIALGSPLDTEFLDLKNYDLYPERGEIGWMSNNSVVLSDREHFSALPEIAARVTRNGEPGIINLINARRYGRYGDEMPDNVTGINPCGEIPLESNELCNLVEVFPTRCYDDAEIYAAMKLGTFYASTVSLLASHSDATNAVVERNRRIGVSVSGIADWIDSTDMSHVFDVLNVGYEQVVRPTNQALAKEAGVPASIRLTTVKPSGSISLLAGVSAGMHHPLHGYVLRRMRVAQNSPVSEVLARAGVPHEPDVASDNTEVFEFPLHYGNGKTRAVKKVSVWEQAAIVAMLQKAWADNSVSNTLTVQPQEFWQIEHVLTAFAPITKSLALLPDKPMGTYAQMPLEKLSKAKFEELSSKMDTPDWTALTGTESSSPRFCDSDVCEV